MFEKTNYIELSGEKYPIKCDILVLERIQDKYEDLSEFENRLNGFTPAVDENGEYKRNEEGRLVGFYGEPKIETLRDALEWMVREGIEIERENGKEIQEVSGKTLTRKVDMAPRELAEILHAEFARCFGRKNPKTTQREKKAHIQPSASEPWSSYPFFSSSCYFSMESLLKSSKIGAVRMVSAPFT